MVRTLCTYAVGSKKYRAMAIAMMQSAREVADCSVDRFVVFSDSTDWTAAPEWIEIIQLEQSHGIDRFANWAIKPQLLQHPAVANDLLIYIDADSTVYRDVLKKCFDWLEAHSLLVFMDFTEADQNWGRVNLKEVYAKAGFDALNITINAGIMGRKPDQIGKMFQKLYREGMDALFLKEYFEDPMYQLNDEPYAGLAFQQTYSEFRLPLPEHPHPLAAEDYMLTIGANPGSFRKKPGPVIRVPWCDHDVIRPAIVHWISSTQYFFYRQTLWRFLARAGMLRPYFLTLVADEFSVIRKRILLKIQNIARRFSTENAQ